jgi:hypothetical protein
VLEVAEEHDSNRSDEFIGPQMSAARREAMRQPGARVIDGRLFCQHDHGMVEFFSPNRLGGYDDYGPGAAAEYNATTPSSTPRSAKSKADSQQVETPRLAAAAAIEEATEPATGSPWPGDEKQEDTTSDLADEVLMEGPPPVVPRPPQVPALLLPLRENSQVDSHPLQSGASGDTSHRSEELLPPGAVLTAIDHEQDQYGTIH